MDLRGILIEIHLALRDAGVDHALIGGLALASHGAARATVDRTPWRGSDFRL